MDLYKPSIYVVIEMRCDPSKLCKSLKKLGFHDNVFMENNCFSGGIVVSWKKNHFKVQLYHKSSQFIHVKMQEYSANEWLFTTIYASPNESRRKTLWDDLKGLAVNIRDPWILAGDFDDIASVADKKGGAPVSLCKCKIFSDRINDCKLMNIEADGPKFTWRGPIFHEGSEFMKNLIGF